MPFAAVTLDLEPDHAGRAEPRYDGWSPERLAAMTDALRSLGAPLSAFVVGRSLEDQPAAIDQLRRDGTEFHLHSYSHVLERADSEEEIDRGMSVFAKTFGHKPTGYRAPEGRISEAGLRRLSDRSFTFDSSVFPSAWPHPRYLAYPRNPYRTGFGSLIEVPIATASPLRLLVTLSFVKLLGFPLYRLLLRPSLLPDPLIFDLHIHDLFALPAFDDLPAFLKVAYSRNRLRGFELLHATLRHLKENGYTFVTMNEAASHAQKTLAPC